LAVSFLISGSRPRDNAVVLKRHFAKVALEMTCLAYVVGLKLLRVCACADRQATSANCLTDPGPATPLNYITMATARIHLSIHPVSDVFNAM